MTDFVLIRPVAITEAMLVSSIAEPAAGADADPAAWAAATAYATGNRVFRATTHKIYERINQPAAAADATLPEVDAALAVPTKWLEVSATNKWRMFDAANESQSSAADEIQVTLTPGQIIDTLAVLNCDGQSVRLQEIGGTGYDRTVQLTTRAVAGWLDYFTTPFTRRPDVVFNDIPLRASNVYVLTVSNPGGVARIGNCVLGRSKRLGGTQFGATAGIIDYTQKSANQFGVATIVKRPYSKRMSVSLMVNADSVDDVQRTLAEYRATPLLWIGAGDLYGALMVYGFWRQFEIVIAYPRFSLTTLEIEGLT